MSTFTLQTLSSIVASRATADARDSYTKSLLDGGIEKVARKFGEESLELIIAAIQGKRTQITAEAADVLFHLLILLHVSNISLDSVLSELEQRTKQSGLEEKARRTQQ